MEKGHSIMTKAVTANTFKCRLGSFLKDLKEHKRFVILRRNIPVGIFLSLEDYVKEHADEYEDVQDFIDTWLEQEDPEFQRSLKESAKQYARGEYITHAQLKALLAGKKLSA